jgi:hypothetical protein
MDKFYRSSISDLNNRGTLAKQKAGTMPSNSNTGLKASDWIGLGLQLYGASMADRQAEEDQQKQDEKDLKEKQENATLLWRKNRQDAQQFEEQMQNQRRGMNMQGLEFLANQRADAMKRGRYISLRNSFAKALSGGN